MENMEQDEQIIEKYIGLLPKFECNKCTARKKNCKCIPPPLKSRFVNDLIPVVIISSYPKYIDENLGKMFQTPDKEVIKSWLTKANRNNFYITNAVKCPTDDDREPTKKEIITCSSIYLNRELTLIEPRVIVTLGEKALTALYPNRPKELIKNMLFKKQQLTVNSAKTKTNYLRSIFPVYHPAYISRGGGDLEEKCIELLTEAFKENISCQNKNKQ